MLYRRQIVFIFLWIFIMSGLGSRQVFFYFFGKITIISSYICWELAGLLSSPVFPVFLHTNKVSSSILMRCLPPY